jgi:hypothetical protein
VLPMENVSGVPTPSIKRMLVNFDHVLLVQPGDAPNRSTLVFINGQALLVAESQEAIHAATV